MTSVCLGAPDDCPGALVERNEANRQEGVAPHTACRCRAGFENKDVGRAAKTWTGDKWKDGAGGPPWDSIGYDPALDLLYFGTGNATAWYRALRGGGDNLYTASIVAVHAGTGELAWYFQPTPGDNWTMTQRNL